MYNEEEVEDSLAFCREIKIFYESGIFNNPRNVFRWDQYVEVQPWDEEYVKKEKKSTLVEQENVQKDTEVEESIGIWLRHRFLEVAVCVIMAFCLASFVNGFIGTHTIVEGHSMENSLHDEDCLIIDKLTYRFVDPKRFDIIVFPFNDTTYYIKRIIGLPGETIKISEGNIYINGELLEEDYGVEAMEDGGIASKELHLGEDEYFVLGDNRNHSKDSRSVEVGFIHRNKIVGKALFRVYPFSDMCVFKNDN